MFTNVMINSSYSVAIYNENKHYILLRYMKGLSMFNFNFKFTI